MLGINSMEISYELQLYYLFMYGDYRSFELRGICGYNDKVLLKLPLELSWVCREVLPSKQLGYHAHPWYRKLPGCFFLFHTPQVFTAWKEAPGALALSSCAHEVITVSQAPASPTSAPARLELSGSTSDRRASRGARDVQRVDSAQKV